MRLLSPINLLITLISWMVWNTIHIDKCPHSLSCFIFLLSPNMNITNYLEIVAKWSMIVTEKIRYIICCCGCQIIMKHGTPVQWECQYTRAAFYSMNYNKWAQLIYKTELKTVHWETFIKQHYASFGYHVIKSKLPNYSHLGTYQTRFVWNWECTVKKRKPKAVN